MSSGSCNIANQTQSVVGNFLPWPRRVLQTVNRCLRLSVFNILEDQTQKIINQRNRIHLKDRCHCCRRIERERERERERETDTQTHRHTHRQTNQYTNMHRFICLRIFRSCFLCSLSACRQILVMVRVQTRSLPRVYCNIKQDFTRTCFHSNYPKFRTPNVLAANHHGAQRCRFYMPAIFPTRRLRSLLARTCK